VKAYEELKFLNVQWKNVLRIGKVWKVGNDEEYWRSGSRVELVSCTPAFRCGGRASRSG